MVASSHYPCPIQFSAHFPVVMHAYKTKQQPDKLRRNQLVYSKLQSQNDTVPTKRYDAAAFYQQATISLAKNQMLVVEFPSKPISSWLRNITQNDDASTNLDDTVLDMPHRYQLLVIQQAYILHNDSKLAVALNQTMSLRL
ncbi:hypothetical protein F511_10261 [Dorcoceras hygrometricum]|uniref:Uncharacterized protein n=1 Tax=Dorcoceras hygrometricum TaxID=472368 RepID=A0A2Z7AA52_9LAMI|nr:hypothetical protein F511_10261 [Dorcoceras hygrometricum]